jgi:protein-tyrosine phosphatase
MTRRPNGPRDGWFVLRPNRRPSVSILLPNLTIGEYPQYDDVTWLRAAHGVNAVVNLQDHGDLASKGLELPTLAAAYERAAIAFHHVPIPDGDTETLRARVHELVALLQRLVAGGERVYLHCNGGYNRAPTVAIAFLHESLHMPLPDAVAFVKQRRPCVPYLRFLESVYPQRPA